MRSNTVIQQPAPSAAELLALLETACQIAFPTDWEMRVRRVLRDFLGDTDPADLSPDKLSPFTERRCNHGRNPGTSNTDYSTNRGNGSQTKEERQSPTQEAKAASKKLQGRSKAFT
jgi:hypothetical protein